MKQQNESPASPAPTKKILLQPARRDRYNIITEESIGYDDPVLFFDCEAEGREGNNVLCFFPGSNYVVVLVLVVVADAFLNRGSRYGTVRRYTRYYYYSY